jgi:hypothetical protein
LILPVVLLILRPRSLNNWACLAACAILLFSLTCKVQIGIRYMLPAVCLAITGLATATAATYDSINWNWARRLLGAAACAGAIWTASAAVFVWPDGLRYINEVWGGTANGYLRLSDSNYDWGQGLKELARWQRDHGMAPLDVWYFGTDPNLASLPMRSVYLQVPPANTRKGLFDLARGRYLAASTTLLYGIYCPENEATSFLRALMPIDRTGRSSFMT